MSREGYRLPPDFEALERFVAGWAIDKANDRARRRLHSSESERAAFYLAASARLDDALALLDRKPLAEHDDTERCLMSLMLTLAHVSLAVEVQKEQEAEHAIGRQHMVILRATADLGH